MRKVFIAALLAAAGCGPSISTTPTNPSPRPLIARPPQTLEVFTTQRPRRPYVEIAVFTASKGQASDHIDALREHAAGYGCDALVFTVMPSQQNYSTADVGTSGQSVGSSSATCIVWNDGGPAMGPPGAVPAAAPAP